MFEKCLHCDRLGIFCPGPCFYSMSASYVTMWCKQSIGLSNARLLAFAIDNINPNIGYIG